MRQIRHNADRDLRDLERQAAAGDPSAREELLAARLRAGVFHSAARVLIEDADGRLPIDVIHSLHAELMRYDLMEKTAAATRLTSSSRLKARLSRPWSVSVVMGCS